MENSEHLDRYRLSRMVEAEDELGCVSYFLLCNTLPQLDQLKTIQTCNLTVSKGWDLDTG